MTIKSKKIPSKDPPSGSPKVIKISRNKKKYTTDLSILKKEVVIYTYRGSGPGGQHRNVTDSGVRIVHRPSGIVVTATESRSQFRNKEKAFERLIFRLMGINRVTKPRISTKKTKAVREKILHDKRKLKMKKEKRKKPNLED